MIQTLQQISNFERYNSFGKKQFIKYIQEWCAANLKNYTVQLDKSFLVISKWEFLKVAALLLNLVIVLSVSNTVGIVSIVGVIISSILVYLICFKLILLILTVIIPSNNIVIARNEPCKIKNHDTVIICAHYDTKNAVIKGKKGKLQMLLKKNVYSISRLFGSYILKTEKILFTIILGYYILVTGEGNPSIQAFYTINDKNSLLGLSLAIIPEIIYYALFSTLFVYALTFPFIKTMNNCGADDNGSGVCALLSIAAFLDKYSLSADIKFILFDNEERGLIGSTHFAGKYSSELRSSKCKVINIDCVGRGESIYITTDRQNNNAILNLLISSLKEKGVGYEISDIDYSDHKPFSQIGLDSLTVSRYDTNKYLWIRKFPSIDWIHGSEDEINHVDINKISQIAEVVDDFLIKNYCRT